MLYSSTIEANILKYISLLSSNRFWLKQEFFQKNIDFPKTLAAEEIALSSSPPCQVRQRWVDHVYLPLNPCSRLRGVHLSLLKSSRAD